MSSSHKWENDESNNDFIARLAEKLMHDTLNIDKTGALPVTGTNFLVVAVGSNPTWSERHCQDRKAMQMVSTARFFQALTTTPLVLVARTPLAHEGGRGWFESNKVKAGFQCCALHRARVGKVRVLVRAVPTETSIYGLRDDITTRGFNSHYGSRCGLYNDLWRNWQYAVA